MQGSLFEEKIMHVENYFSKFIIKVPFQIKIFEVIKKMHENHVRNLFVEKEKEIIGVLTVREIMKFLEKEPSDIYNTDLSVLSLGNLVKVNIKEKVEKVAKLMIENDVGLVAIEKENNIIGKIGERDLLLLIPRLNLKKRVIDIMKKEVIKISPENTILDAIKAKNKAKSRHIPVIEKEILIGMFSSRDLLKIISRCNNEKELEEALNKKVKEEMKRDPLTIDPYAYITSAANLMISKNIGALPVLDIKELVGIITERDFIKLLSYL